MKDDSSSFFGQHTFGSPSVECYEQDNISLDSNVDQFLVEDWYGNYNYEVGSNIDNNQDVPCFLPFESALSSNNTEEVVEVELLKLLKDMRAPLYAYDNIMKWASKATSMGHEFNPNF
jgi:hypothetical protein